MSKKPDWVLRKEQDKRREVDTLWLFGLHAVRDALLNPAREKLRLVVTLNAKAKLEEAIETAGIAAQVVEPRRFSVPLDPGSVHQGAALEVRPLSWGSVDQLLQTSPDPVRILCLDRVSDPHNVGAILRSAEVFGAFAVMAPKRHSAPETGALAKTASGALERQPYLRVGNLAASLEDLRDRGFVVIGLDGTAEQDITEATQEVFDRPIALVLGAEGPGLRAKTKETCDILAKIPARQGFASLNVSNAAAVALFATTNK